MNYDYGNAFAHALHMMVDMQLVNQSVRALHSDSKLQQLNGALIKAHGELLKYANDRYLEVKEVV